MDCLSFASSRIVLNLAIVQGLFSTPLSNTGSNSQSARGNSSRVETRIDAVTLLWDYQAGIAVAEVLERFIGVVFDWTNPVRRKIGVVWDRNYSSPCGCVYSERDGANGKIFVRLSISGEACARNRNLRLRGLLNWVRFNLLNLRCSRLDIAIDDYGKNLDLQDVEDALRDGNYSGFCGGKIVKEFGKEHNGWTVYLGSRESEKYIRAYDKESESKGLIKSIRWEIEFKDTSADELLALILGCPDDDEIYQSNLANFAVGTLKFIDKTDKNIGRNTVLKWWSDWLAYIKATPYKVRVLRVKTTIESKKDWVRSKVAKSLLMLRIVLQETRFNEFLTEIINDAKQRITNFDELLMDDYFGKFGSVGGTITERVRINLWE
jgi:Replication initiation factor